MSSQRHERFALHFDAATHRRVIAGKEVIIHCHHYNARLQSLVEGATAIDGRAIVVDAAEAVFADHLMAALQDEDDSTARWCVAEELYAHLGYGRIDLGGAEEGVVTASESHFVEGWRAGFAERTAPVCSLTTGFLQGAIGAITGEAVRVVETQCMIDGSDACRFEIHHDRTTAFNRIAPPSAVPHQAARLEVLTSATVDEAKIIEALVSMPIYGGEDGLIPGFNVYLANTPAEFYNLVCIRFVQQMTAAGLEMVARQQLTRVAETCAMNTFRGIMDSPEWAGLVAPMVKQRVDNLFGIVAVSNGLGWGNWRVAEHTEDESLELVSANGYEADGYLQLRGGSSRAECMMLSGVSAGIMELLYGEGSVDERFGQFAAAEDDCRCSGKHHCRFVVEAAA